MIIALKEARQMSSTCNAIEGSDGGVVHPPPWKLCRARGLGACRGRAMWYWIGHGISSWPSGGAAAMSRPKFHDAIGRVDRGIRLFDAHHRVPSTEDSLPPPVQTAAHSGFMLSNSTNKQSTRDADHLATHAHAHAHVSAHAPRSDSVTNAEFLNMTPKERNDLTVVRMVEQHKHMHHETHPEVKQENSRSAFANHVFAHNRVQAMRGYRAQIAKKTGRR